MNRFSNSFRLLWVLVISGMMVLPHFHCASKKYHGRKKRYKYHRKKVSHRQKRKCPCVEYYQAPAFSLNTGLPV